MVALLGGRPVGDGKTRPSPPDRWCAVSRTANAPLLKGTRCICCVLVCSAGIVQVAVVRSISVHVACLTSPLLVAVRVRNLKAAIVAQWASVVSTVRMAAPTLLWGRAFMCWGRWVLEPRAAVIRSSAGLFSRNPLRDAPFHHRGDPLFHPAGRFGFWVPYWGETSHDIGGRDLVHPLFPKVRIGVGVEG